MFRIKYFILSVIIIVGSLTLTNCGTQEPNTEPFELSLLTNYSDYYTLQAIAIRSSETLKNDVYDARFGENNIEVFKTANNVLGFFIPEVNTGNYTLSIEGFSQSFEFKVRQTQLSKSPEELVSDVAFYGFHTIDKALRKADSLVKIGYMSDDDLLINELKSAKDSANAVLDRFAKLDDTKKQQAALFIEANLQAFYQFDNIIYGIYEDGSFKRGPCNSVNSFFRTRCLIGQMMLGVASMAAPLALGGMIGGGLGAYISGGAAAQPLAIAGAIVGGIIFYKLLILPGMVRVKNAWSELANMAIIAADDLMAEISLNKKSISFMNNEPKEIEFSFNARNLQAKDSESSDFSEVGILISTYNEIASQMGYSKIGYSSLRTSRINVDNMSTAQVTVLSGNVSAQVKTEGAKAFMLVNTESNQIENFSFTISVGYGNSTLTSNPIDAQIGGGAVLGDVNVNFLTNNISISYKAEENPYDMDKYVANFKGKLVMEGPTPNFDKLQIKAKADKNWSGNMQSATFPINYNPNDSTFQISITMSTLDDFYSGMVKTIKVYTKDDFDPFFEPNANYYINYTELIVSFSEI